MNKMNEKLYNLLQDPNLSFYIAPTRELQFKLLENHPLLAGLRASTKAGLLEGKILFIDNQDIYDYLTNQLTKEEYKFLLDSCDIRVVGEPSIHNIII